MAVDKQLNQSKHFARAESRLLLYLAYIQSMQSRDPQTYSLINNKKY